MGTGVSYISERYSKANNKDLKSYEPKQESKHFICLDANHIYGHAISKFFQKSDSNRYTLKSFTRINIPKIVRKIVF